MSFLFHPDLSRELISPVLLENLRGAYSHTRLDDSQRKLAKAAASVRGATDFVSWQSDVVRELGW